MEANSGDRDQTPRSVHEKIFFTCCVILHVFFCRLWVLLFEINFFTKIVWEYLRHAKPNSLVPNQTRRSLSPNLLQMLHVAADDKFEFRS